MPKAQPKLCVWLLVVVAVVVVLCILKANRAFKFLKIFIKFQNVLENYSEFYNNCNRNMIPSDKHSSWPSKTAIHLPHKTKQWKR